MSQSNVIARERATRLAIETIFGTTPSGSFPEAMTRCFPIGDDLILEGLAEEMLPVGDERVRRLDAIHPVHGLQIASKVGALKCLLKATPSANQLTAAGAAGSLVPRILLKHALGTEHAAVGSLVATGSSATSFIVTGGEGVNFEKGDFILVTISGEPEWTQITNISTDTLTVSPALSTTPSTSAVVRNLYNYVPAESHTSSLAISQAFVGDSAAQVTANGCYGDLTFDFPEFGKLAAMSLALTATSFTGPSAQSIGVATATDEMGAAFAWAPKVYLATSVARATSLVCEGASVEFANSWELIRDPGATQTVSGVVNTGGRPVAVKASIKLRFDSQYPTAFDADTAYRLIIVQKIGTGTTASFWIWSLPSARLVAQPKLTKIGERLHMELALEGTPSTLITDAGETGADADRINSPFFVAFG
jgi:hypothetical protein